MVKKQHSRQQPMENLREEISALLKEGLFSSAWTLASFLVSHKSKKRASAQDRANDWTLFGDAAFGLTSYAQARGFYQKGLGFIRGASSKESKMESAMIEYQIKLRIADCHIKLREHDAALVILKAIPFKHRPLRHSLKLARLLEQRGRRKLAIHAYQEILDRTKGTRMVIEAAQALARLQTPTTGRKTHAASSAGHTAAATAAAAAFVDRLPFIEKLTTAHGLTAKYKLGMASKAFEVLLEEFPGNLYLMVRQATLQFDMGKLDEALELFRGARELYPLSCEGADTHALILRIRERTSELSRLTQDLIRKAPDRPEPWIVCSLDYSTEAKLNSKKAMECLNRVLCLYPGHTGALLAKGFLHLRHNDGKRAALAYNRVKGISTGITGIEEEPISMPVLPRFCVFQGLVEAFLQMHEVKRALSVAKEALELMPHNPKSLTLIGIVLSQSPEMKEKACKAFKRALSIDKKCLDAVEALSRFYHLEKRYDKIIELLKEQLKHRRRDYLHIRLGDAYKMSGDLELALEQYHAALVLTPDHREALKGIETLEMAAKDESMMDDVEEDVDDELEG